MRHDAHGYWLYEAGAVDPLPPLEGDASCDVAVVGGGYSGLWTAWALKELEPELKVTLLDAGICGEGPSGRNGGFVNSMWYALSSMRSRFGDEQAAAIGRAAQSAIDGVGDFCERQSVDAWYRKGGYLQISTTPVHDAMLGETVDSCHQLGADGACVVIDADEVQERCRSPLFRAGLHYPGSATVQPARLGRGLRSRLTDRGVTIHERTRVRSVAAEGAGVAIDADGGRLRAGAAVLAAGPALAGMHPLRRRLTLTSSHMVITEPVPEVLEEIGWTGGECITDSRAMLHYLRTTPDGRIAFGWGGGRVIRGARVVGRAEVDSSVASQVADDLRRFFPELAGKRIAHAWGGPIDVSPTHLPVLGSIEGGRVHYAFGYTGNGVGPSHLCGRILAKLALDRRDEDTRLALVEPPTVRVPPEPFRYVGGTIIREALLRKEAAEEEGRRPSALTRAVAGIPERIGIHIGR